MKIRYNVSTNPKTKCTAFTNDHRRCRLESLPINNENNENNQNKQNNHSVCEIHKNYYTAWFTKHPPPIGLDSLNKRMRNEYEFQIKNKYVKPTKQIVSELTDATYMTDYYLLLCSSGIDPLWNKNLLIRCITSFTYDYLKYRFYGLIYNSSRIHSMLEILCQSQELTHSILKSFLVVIYNIIKSQASLPESERLIRYSEFEGYVTELWNHISTSPVMICLYKSREFTNVQKQFQEKIAPYKWSNSLYKNVLEPIFKHMEAYTKASIKSRVNIYKEELMMVCWSPQRVQSYLEAGVDWDQM